MTQQEAVMSKVLRCNEGDILLAVSYMKRYGVDPEEVADAIRADLLSHGYADPVQAVIRMGMSANTLLGLHIAHQKSAPGASMPRVIEVTDPELAAQSLLSLRSAIGVLDDLDETNPVGPRMQDLFNDVYRMVEDRVTLPEPRTPRKGM